MTDRTEYTLASQLDDILENVPIEKFDNKYIFIFGPYMCMTNGYEAVCDKIAKNNIIMRYILWCAFLIRKTAGMKYIDAAKEINWFIRFIDNQYFEHDSVKNKFIEFAQSVLRCCKKFNSVDEKTLENFIACAAPIIQYNGAIEKKDDEFDSSCYEELYTTIDYKSNNNTIEVALTELLLNNMMDILAGCGVIANMKANLTKALTHLAIKTDYMPIDAQRYYLLAAIYYYKLTTDTEIDQFFKLFQNFGISSEPIEYDAFESLVSEYVNSMGVPSITANEFDETELDNKEQDAIKKLTKSVTHDKPVYNLDKINDFISINRYMQFEEYPNRLFLGSLDNIKILNIINMGGDRNYYECMIDDNSMFPVIFCPFLDIRDLTAKVIIYNIEYDKIITENI